MATVLINDEYLNDIAEAIREKNNAEGTYKPSEMAAAIRAIQVGGGNSPVEFYVNSGGGARSGPEGFTYPFDTKDFTVMYFKYDYNHGEARNSAIITVYLGYTMAYDEHLEYYAPVQVDEFATTRVVHAAYQTAVAGQEIGVDVSNYSSAIICVDFNGGTTAATGCVHVYDIEFEQEV